MLSCTDLVIDFRQHSAFHRQPYLGQTGGWRRGGVRGASITHRHTYHSDNQWHLLWYM